MSEPRVHLEGSKLANHPTVKNAFATIAAILIATNAKDLECDIQGGDKQFHFDVLEVADNGVHGA